MQELAWVHWLWIVYFVSALIFFAENMREIYYDLKAEKLDKINKRKCTVSLTYGHLIWNMSLPFIPIINTIAALMLIAEYIERKLMMLKEPVIKPYKGE